MPVFNVQGSEFLVETTDSGLTVNGTPVSAALWSKGKFQLTVELEGVTYPVLVHQFDTENKVITLSLRGQKVRIPYATEADQLLKRIGLSGMTVKKVGELRAPMPGLIHSIIVSEGQTVKKGDPLLILEAMKMENVIKSPADGTVARILVQPKDSVEKNAVLISF